MRAAHPVFASAEAEYLYRSALNSLPHYLSYYTPCAMVNSFYSMVRVTRFEHATTWSQTRSSTRLSYTRIKLICKLICQILIKVNNFAPSIYMLFQIFNDKLITLYINLYIAVLIQYSCFVSTRSLFYTLMK